jgi:rubrerythrin
MAEAMLEASEVDQAALLRQTTVRALIQAAIRFEWNAHHFYSGLIDRVRPALASLVAELANEEREHHKHLVALLESEDFMDELHKQIPLPHTAARFEHLIDNPDLPEEPTDDDILALALAREEAAAEHYARLAVDAEHPAMREAFAYLRDEEINHVAQLGERWGRLGERRPPVCLA